MYTDHLTVGVGLPLRQQSSLQVSRDCMTRGRSWNVNTGAVSEDSCQKVYGKASRRRGASGKCWRWTFGTAAREKIPLVTATDQLPISCTFCRHDNVIMTSQMFQARQNSRFRKFRVDKTTMPADQSVTCGYECVNLSNYQKYKNRLLISFDVQSYKS